MADWKQQLVDQVKAWQRMSASHKESWYRFVQQKTGAAQFDPNRHDEATLSEFIQMGQAGQIELMDPTGLGSSDGNKGGGWGVGGGNSWPSKGGGKAFGKDAGKQALVDRVKAWQRMSESHKEAWYRFVQEKTWEGNFDPNRHDEATLGQFLQMADAGLIELVEPTGFGSSGGKKGKGKGGWGDGGGKGKSKGGGVAFDMTAGMQGLVEQVKSWQRMSASHKEAWYRFAQENTAEANFDPNRHDEETLRGFLQMAEAGQIELQEPTGFGDSGRNKGKGGGGWGDDAGSWAPMQKMAELMMSMMGAGGKGGKKEGKKGWSPY